MEKQPVNEAYSHELLEAYTVARDIVFECENLIYKRIPYEEWPENCKIAGVSEDLMGHDSSVLMLEMSKHSKTALKDLKKCLEKGWKDVQSNCRPDQSFRAMVEIFQKWVKYIESCEKKSRKKQK
jgi:hypothetical protein